MHTAVNSWRVLPVVLTQDMHEVLSTYGCPEDVHEEVWSRLRAQSPRVMHDSSVLSSLATSLYSTMRGDMDMCLCMAIVMTVLDKLSEEICCPTINSGG